MKRASGGKWTATLKPLPGTYEYNFVVDGEWCCEAGSDSIN